MSGATASRVRAVETHAEIGRKIRELMWRDVGLVRTGDGLQDAVHGLTRVARRLRPGGSEIDKLLTVAGLLTSGRRAGKPIFAATTCRHPGRETRRRSATDDDDSRGRLARGRTAHVDPI